MIIRKEQFQILTADASNRFRNSLVDHVREKFPVPAAFVPRENIDHLVDDATAKARGYGFRAAGPLRFFVDCAVLLGASFDEDPLLFWIRDILVDRSDNDEMTKAARVHMHLDNYLVRVYGTRGQLALPGLQQAANVSQSFLVSAGTSPDSLIAWLRSLHPEKCEYAGQTALRLLVASARDDATQAGFPQDEGTALLAGLKFAFGTGVLSDQLFPWLRASWPKEAESAEGRYLALEKRSKAYMRRVLQVVTAAQGGSATVQGG